jgi:hypothetical protein
MISTQTLPVTSDLNPFREMGPPSQPNPGPELAGAWAGMGLQASRMRSRRPPDIACTVEVRAAQIRLAENVQTTT